MQIMRLRNLSEVEAIVSVESDVKLNEESLAQYNKVYQCKEKAFETLARTLKVSPNTFKGCDTDNVIDLMETIFWILSLATISTFTVGIIFTVMFTALLSGE